MQLFSLPALPINCASLVPTHPNISHSLSVPPASGSHNHTIPQSHNPTSRLAPSYLPTIHSFLTPSSRANVGVWIKFLQPMDFELSKNRGAKLSPLGDHPILTL